MCIGLNFRDHAEETGAPLPDEPVVFLKDPSTIVGPFDDVLIPRASSSSGRSCPEPSGQGQRVGTLCDAALGRRAEQHIEAVITARTAYDSR